MTSASDAALPIDNPFLQWMGVTLHAWTPGYAEMRLLCSDQLSNRTSRIHGGVLCTLLDSVSGYSGLYAPAGEPPLRALTLSLTTNFLDAADGEVLTAKGYVVRKGRSIFFARAEVWLDESRLLATSVGTFKYVR
ncbi:MAG TPA: PaaI family thioesterase [Burkholderiaceae bacterium]|nr:PaaI family thioesterase [Burkholderiaceae bacterium]